MEATFCSNRSSAILESPVVAAFPARCLTFKYQLSSPKITVFVLTSIANDSNDFTVIDRFTYGTAAVLGWSNATVKLSDDVVKFRIVANQTAVTTQVQFALVDSVVLSPCFIGKAIQYAPHSSNQPDKYFANLDSVHCRTDAMEEHEIGSCLSVTQ